MAYRPTKEKAEAQKAARELYVTYELSLKEIHQKTGEPMRTLRAWCNLGDWEGLRAKTELDRFRSLRDSLLDKAEAQIKAGKLPHTEIGLMYKLERLIDRRERSGETEIETAVNTITCFGEYLLEHGLAELAQAFAEHYSAFGKWLLDQDQLPSLHDPAFMKKKVKYSRMKLDEARGQRTP